MMLVCEICGGTGFSGCMVICEKCKCYAIHRYCLVELKLGDEEVSWNCENCQLKCFGFVPSIDKQILVERDTGVLESQNDVVIKDLESLRKIPKDWEMSNESDTFCLTVNTNETSYLTKKVGTKGGKGKRRRKLILVDEYSDEDAEPRGVDVGIDEVKNVDDQNDRSDVVELVQRQGSTLVEGGVDYLQGAEKLEFGGHRFHETLASDSDREFVLNFGFESSVCEDMTCHQTIDKASKDMHGCPVFEPVWRGSFRLRDYKYGEVKAHLSDRACERVLIEARSMPTVLCFEVHRRSDVWPKSFQKCPPNGENVALYFFPNSEKDEQMYAVLLDDIISSDLALRVLLDNSELLMFPSFLLPEAYHCFDQRYYIWGVFKKRSSVDSFQIDGNSEQVRTSFHPSNEAPERIIESVASLPFGRALESSLPTPDAVHQQGKVDSVTNNGRSGSMDSSPSKMTVPFSSLTSKSQFQQPEPCEDGIQKLRTNDVTDNVPHCLEKTGLDLPVSSCAQDDVPNMGSLLSELGEVQDDTAGCLNLFPLVGEDLAVTVRMGSTGRINLELGLARQDAGKLDGRKTDKSMESRRNLLW